jgi:hypothetical protein
VSRSLKQKLAVNTDRVGQLPYYFADVDAALFSLDIRAAAGESTPSQRAQGSFRNST